MSGNLTESVVEDATLAFDWRVWAARCSTCLCGAHRQAKRRGAAGSPDIAVEAPGGERSIDRVM